MWCFDGAMVMWEEWAIEVKVVEHEEKDRRLKKVAKLEENEENEKQREALNKRRKQGG